MAGEKPADGALCGSGAEKTAGADAPDFKTDGSIAPNATLLGHSRLESLSGRWHAQGECSRLRKLIREYADKAAFPCARVAMAISAVLLKQPGSPKPALVID